MHFLVSPAKTLDFERTFFTPTPTRARFHDQTAVLIDTLREKSAHEIAALMDLSPALAELSVARYAAWRPRYTAHNSRPAVVAFNGDVYEGLDAPSLGVGDLAWAQAHVSILSGLHGLLRPLDRIQPYRLEMGTALATEHARNLYAFWGDTLARQLNRQLAKDATPVVVNLASQEYSRAVLGQGLKATVIDCVFEDWKPGGYKIVSFFAKRARGLMLRHAIQNRLDEPAGLLEFDAEGYRFEASVSDAARLVFRRRMAG